MIVILEGPDNAGKSTLGRQLAADAGLELVHPGGPPANISEVVARCIEQDKCLNMSNLMHFIYDRVTCISDACYRLNPNYRRMYERFQDLLAADTRTGHALIIYCRPPTEVICNFDSHETQDHETQDDVEYAKRNIIKIVDAYDATMDRLQFERKADIITYDYTDYDGDETYEMIVKKILRGTNEGQLTFEF